MHFHPVIAIVIFPSLILYGCFRLPYIKLNDTNQGIWFLSENGKKSALYSLISGVILTVIFILASEYMPDPEAILPAIPGFITTGLIPIILVIGSIGYYIKFIKIKLSLNRSEMIQSLVIILVTSYSILTVTGIFFRGEGMKLIWPWMM